MSDLISRELLVKEIVNRPTKQSGYNPVYLNGCATRQNEIIDIINDMPTVEAVPVVHGKWKMRGGRLYCTNCEKKALEKKDRDDWYGCVGSNFCPNCGADMRTSAE